MHHPTPNNLVNIVRRLTFAPPLCTLAQVGGLEWRLKLWPSGDDAAGGDHLSGVQPDEELKAES